MTPETKLPVYDYQQEPPYDLKTWIACQVAYVNHPDLGSTERAVYLPYCEKVIYSHTYWQNGNVSDRKPRLAVKLEIITSTSTNAGQFGVWNEYSFSYSRFVLKRIDMTLIGGDTGKITYQIEVPLKPDEVLHYRPADMTP